MPSLTKVAGSQRDSEEPTWYGQANFKLDLLHPIHGKTNDLSIDLTIGILESCTDGWQHDGDNPLSIYFAKSPSKCMLDIGTILKGKNIPFMDQLPAFAVFDSHEQYYVTTAIATQQEKEYQDRQNGKLHELEVTARFVPNRRSLHPENKAPQEYFMLINASSVGPDVDYLLPRNGDSADVVLLSIFTTPQKVNEDMGDVDNDHISMHIKESIEDVLDDASIESKSASDHRITTSCKYFAFQTTKATKLMRTSRKCAATLRRFKSWLTAKSSF